MNFHINDLLTKTHQGGRGRQQNAENRWLEGVQRTADDNIFVRSRLAEAAAETMLKVNKDVFLA